MIAIIDYGLGNLASVKNALDALNIPNEITSNPLKIRQAAGLVLPGVGAAGEGMKNLRENGLDKIILEEVKKGKPLIGVCLGMQLLFERSDEDKTKCLGILKGTVKKFKKEKKIPQIGWNNVKTNKGKLFKGIPDNSYFYFVHSYYCSPTDRTVVIGETQYGEKFASAVSKDNVFATQFHPERSSKNGLRIYKNFWEEICK